VAQAHLDARSMPSWAEEACGRWGEMLDRLEQAPTSVATTLDWAIKLVLFQRRARHHGAEWSAIEHWNRAARAGAGSLTAAQSPSEDVLSDDDSPPPASAAADELARLSPYLEQQGLDPRNFEALPKLRQELFEIDVRFGQLGARGIFTALDRDGVLAHRVVGVDNIEHAMAHPPATGRARVRGEWVRALARERGRFQCDWQAVMDWEQLRRIDLSDPFATEAAWQPFESGGLARERGMRMRLELDL
jgi:hypothetical protein